MKLMHAGNMYKYALFNAAGWEKQGDCDRDVKHFYCGYVHCP